MMGGVDEVTVGAQYELRANVDMPSKLRGVVENDDE